MSPKQPREAANLFAAAGMEQDAPHPLPDRLRPRSLADVVGQDHILGPDGALTRMLETRTLGSLVFWGPPGTGKTSDLDKASKAGSRLWRIVVVRGGQQINVTLGG